MSDAVNGGTQVGQVMPSIRASIDVTRDSGACRLHAAAEASTDKIKTAQASFLFIILSSGLFIEDRFQRSRQGLRLFVGT